MSETTAGGPPQAPRFQNDATNPDLDRLIERLRSLLGPLQARESAAFTAPRLPVTVIVGCPRSGTTLATQLLAATGGFSFPTNVLARFAYAPMIGALVQQLLFDPKYGYGDELADIGSPSPLASVLGRTAGALAVNQFYPFWRRFVPTAVPSHLTDEELAGVDVAGLRRELASIESIIGKPFMSKGKLLQFRAGYFAAQMPELLFVHVKRRPRFVMQSIMLARRAVHGTDRSWWSHRPREFEWLASLDPAHQVAGQVLYTERAIDRELAGVDDDRKLVITYESLCVDPRQLATGVRDIFSRRGFGLDTRDPACGSAPRDHDRLPGAELDELEAAYSELEAGAAKPGKATP